MDAVTQVQLVKKCGGKFKLAALLEKRMRELVRGLPPLTEQADPMDPFETALREISENKVELVLGEEAERLRRELSAREAEEMPRQVEGKGGEKSGKGEKGDKDSKSDRSEKSEKGEKSGRKG